MPIKKCLMCGGTDFIPYSMASGMADEYEDFTDAYACVNCGFILTYAKEDRLQRLLAINNSRKNDERKRLELEEELKTLNAQLQKLRSIVNDENQTVKAVKEAKESIINVENEIRMLESSISRLKSKIY